MSGAVGGIPRIPRNTDWGESKTLLKRLRLVEKCTILGLDSMGG